MGKTYRSNALRAIHETASDLHDTGLMDKRTLRKFDALCLMPWSIPKMNGRKVWRSLAALPVMLFLAATHAAAQTPGAPLHVMRSATLERPLPVMSTDAAASGEVYSKTNRRWLAVHHTGRAHEAQTSLPENKDVAGMTLWGTPLVFTDPYFHKVGRSS